LPQTRSPARWCVCTIRHRFPSWFSSLVEAQLDFCFQQVILIYSLLVKVIGLSCIRHSRLFSKFRVVRQKLNRTRPWSSPFAHFRGHGSGAGQLCVQVWQFVVQALQYTLSFRECSHIVLCSSGEKPITHLAPSVPWHCVSVVWKKSVLYLFLLDQGPNVSTKCVFWLS